MQTSLSSIKMLQLFFCVIVVSTISGRVSAQQQQQTEQTNDANYDLSSSLPNNAENGSCTFCDSTDSFDSSLTFAGIPCDQWALLALFAPPGEQCFVLRAAAVQFCGCPTTVERKCELCPDGTTDGYDPNQSLLFLPELTCSDIVDMPAVDGDDTCAFLDRFSYLCGCPGAVPECSLCAKDSSTGLPLPMSRPDEVLVEGDASKNVPDTTCAQWDKLLSLEVPDDDPVLTVDARDASTTSNPISSPSLTAGCDASKQQAETRIGMQLDGICGCPSVNPARECIVCEPGFMIRKDKTECNSVSFVAPFVTNSTLCEMVRTSSTELDCCVEGNEEEDSINGLNNNQSSAFGVAIGSGALFTAGIASVLLA